MPSIALGSPVHFSDLSYNSCYYDSICDSIGYLAGDRIRYNFNVETGRLTNTFNSAPTMTARTSPSFYPILSPCDLPASHLSPGTTLTLKDSPDPDASFSFGFGPNKDDEKPLHYNLERITDLCTVINPTRLCVARYGKSDSTHPFLVAPDTKEDRIILRCISHPDQRQVPFIYAPDTLPASADLELYLIPELTPYKYIPSQWLTGFSVSFSYTAPTTARTIATIGG